MEDKPRKDNKSLIPQRRERKSDSKSLTFNPQEHSNRRESPSTSNAVPKMKESELNPVESESIGVRTAEKIIKRSKSPRRTKNSHKDLATPDTSKTTTLPPCDVERICLGKDFSNIGCEISPLLFSESLIEEITERQKVLVVDDGGKRSVLSLNYTPEEKFEKCSKSMLHNLKKKTQRIIREKYNCHEEWKRMKREIKELKRMEEEKKVWMLKYLDSPLSEEDDLDVKRDLLHCYHHILQMFLITIIAMSMMSPEMYFFSNQTRSLFLDEITLSNSTFNETENSTAIIQKRSLRDSRSRSDFWAFAETSLINLLYSNLYNPYLDPLTHTAKEDKTHMFANQILGVARIRQVRVTKSSCKIHPDMDRFFEDCYAYYSIFAESTSPIRKDAPSSETETAWKFTEARDLGTSFYCGEISCYGGGGYYLDLAKDKKTSANMLQELRENDWVSKATRAVFIDFTIFNANVNLFCLCNDVLFGLYVAYCLPNYNLAIAFIRMHLERDAIDISGILVEMPPTGGILTTPDFNSLKLIRYLTIADFFFLGLECLYLLLIIYLSCWEIYKMYRQKSLYFFNPWNYLEMFILLLSFVYFGLNILRYYVLESTINKLEERYYEYTEFEFAKDMQLYFNNVIALIVFASWVRLFSFFNFTINMVRFQRTLGRSLVNMAMFIPMFLTMIIAFSILAYLLFGHQVKEYSSIWKSFLTLIQAFLGEFNCTYILETNRVLGPIFYIFFVFFVFFVLVNVFIAIISEAYASVMSVAYSNTPQFGNYLRRGIVNTFTCCRPRVKNERLGSSLRKKLLFQEIQKALKRAGFRDKEIKIFFHKYEINYMNFLDENTKSKISNDLNLKEFEIKETSEQFQIDILKRKYDNLRNRLELLDTKLQPIIDKVDIIVHRL